MSNGLDGIQVQFDWRLYIVPPSNVPFPAIVGERKHEDIENRILEQDNILSNLFDEYKASNEIPNEFKNIYNFFLLYGFLIVGAQVEGDEYVYYCSKSTNGQKNDNPGNEQYNYESWDIYVKDIKGNPERERALEWVLTKREEIRKVKKENRQLDNS